MARAATVIAFMYLVNKQFGVRCSHQSLTASLSIVCGPRARPPPNGRERERAENERTKSHWKFCSTTNYSYGSEIKFSQTRRRHRCDFPYLHSPARSPARCLPPIYSPLWLTQSNGIRMQLAGALSQFFSFLWWFVDCCYWSLAAQQLVTWCVETMFWLFCILFNCIYFSGESKKMEQNWMIAVIIQAKKQLCQSEFVASRASVRYVPVPSIFVDKFSLQSSTTAAETF